MLEQFYRAFLNLYPAKFRREFEEEMVDTFLANVADSSNLIDLLIREALDGLWQAFLMHIHLGKQSYISLSDELRTLVQARWVIRIGSLMINLFFVVTTWSSYQQNDGNQNLFFLVLFLMQLVCVFFALLWERIGGIIMLTTTLTIAPILFSITSQLLPGYLIISIMVTCLWIIPFSGFSIAYLVIGQRQFTIQQGATA